MATPILLAIRDYALVRQIHRSRPRLRFLFPYFLGIGPLSAVANIGLHDIAALGESNRRANPLRVSCFHKIKGRNSFSLRPKAFSRIVLLRLHKTGNRSQSQASILRITSAPKKIAPIIITTWPCSLSIQSAVEEGGVYAYGESSVGETGCGGVTA